MSKKWFKPVSHGGWEKTQKPSTRRYKLYRSTDKMKPKPHRYLTAGRKAQALANVTKDDETRRLAKEDAKYFFNKLKKR